MTQITKGPWRVGEMNAERIFILSENMIVAAVTARAGLLAECEANARAIASVPDLLEALKDARYALYGNGPGNPKIDAAIAQAESAAVVSIATSDAAFRDASKLPNPPHLWNHEDGSGGTSFRWRQFRDCSDGTVVIGYGNSSEQCRRAAQENVNEHEAYLALPARVRLQRLVAGKLLDTDQKEAIRILAELIL